MKRNIHSSWLICALSSGIVVGIFIAVRQAVFIRPEVIVATLCVLFISFTRHDAVSVVFALFCGIVIGLARGNEVQITKNIYEPYQGKTVFISGKIKDDPSLGIEGEIRLRLTDIRLGTTELPGDVWVVSAKNSDVKRSDTVTAEGRLSQGFGPLSASIYRAEVKEIVRQDYADIAGAARDEFGGAIRKGIKEPEASLGAGFLLGQKTALPEKLQNELRILGLTHIVVASGYNLTVLVRFSRRLFIRVSRFSALAMSGVLVILFTEMTGFSPSMSRAALIALLSLIAWYFGRKVHPFVLIPFAAAVTLFVNPTFGAGDIGWLLSFTSFIGVMVLAPLLHAYFWGDKEPNALRQVFIETLSAQAMTLPVVLFVFSEYSPLSLIANILVVPAIPVAMLLSFVVGFYSLFFTFGATLVGYPAQKLLSYITWLVGKMSVLPGVSATATFTSSTLITSYTVLAVLCIFFWRRTGYKFREYSVIE